jgi:hypothetical protein
MKAILAWKKEMKWHAYNTWMVTEVWWFCGKAHLSLDSCVFRLQLSVLLQLSATYINFEGNKLAATMLQGDKLVVAYWILFQSHL